MDNADVVIQNLRGIKTYLSSKAIEASAEHDGIARDALIESQTIIQRAIDLLKDQNIAIDQFMQEQKAKEPVIFGDGATFEEAKNFWYACAVCKNPLDLCDNFCRKCGSAIDWKGAKKDGDGE